jgi:hypothetical protein
MHDITGTGMDTYLYTNGSTSRRKDQLYVEKSAINKIPTQPIVGGKKPKKTRKSKKTRKQTRKRRNTRH